jgi:EAL domain-containing protein (putative c-di-GMP-specific phosphodiesterase class I)
MDSDILVSANLSLRQFQQHDLVKRIASYIEEFNLPPKNFAVEVTESINSLGKDVVIQSLNDFRAMGIHTHIDDFGMGFSSLNHLRRFALDGLKVDRSFVQDAVTNPADAAILKTIIELGKSLSLVVIAEGVETEGQRQMVADFGCDVIQGYFYSKPLTLNEVMPKVIAGF